MRRHAAGVLAGLLCVLLVATMAPASAAKSWSKLMVSQDGTSWTPKLRKPLFREGLRWVPGDTTSRTFYARNQSGQRARLRVVVRVADGARWLCCGHLRVAVGAKGKWRPLRVGTKASGSKVVGSFALAPGEVLPMTLRFRLLHSATPGAMNKTFRFKVKLRLTEMRRKSVRWAS